MASFFDNFSKHYFIENTHKILCGITKITLCFLYFQSSNLRLFDNFTVLSQIAQLLQSGARRGTAFFSINILWTQISVGFFGARFEAGEVKVKSNTPHPPPPYIYIYISNISFSTEILLILILLMSAFFWQKNQHFGAKNSSFTKSNSELC